MNKKILSIFFGVIPFFIFSQERKPLGIGDRIPNITIKHIVNYPNTEIELEKLNGKAVIIDFWGTYCSPCIETLFKMDSLKKKYKDQIEFITVAKFDSEEKVLSTIKRFSKERNMDLPVVINDSILHSYFPYQLVSHLVWISPFREVRAITSGDYMTEQKLKEFLNGKKLNWRVKSDGFGFDNNKPFLDFTQNDITQPEFLYFSTLTANLPNIAPPNGWTIDSVKKVRSLKLYNTTLFELCRLAASNPVSKRENFIFDVKDESKFKWNKSGYYSDWASSNTYCYSLSLPLTISEKEAKDFARDDIRRWLFILGVGLEQNETKFIIHEFDRKNERPSVK